MDIRLINAPDEHLSATEQVFLNRGIPVEELPHYMNLTFDDVNEPECLGEVTLRTGAAKVLKAIQNDEDALIVVDCDCDGYTSAALFINYFNKVFPTWTQNHLHWSLHNDKTHGLSDQEEIVKSGNYKLIICPDSSSNDYEYHKEFKLLYGIDILILDHHLAPYVSPYTTTVNNQLSDYPNKDLSGVGVTWQFCRYLDKKLNTDYANSFLDLVALGNCGDMMSLHSCETRFLIMQGFKKESINNPFIEYMLDKNSFPLSKSDYKSFFSDSACTPMGAAFFVIPFLNAITRSGTPEEKELIFKSMLDFTAFERIPEIKRNKETGNLEPLVLQAVRVIGNVKNRQTRMEDAGLTKLEAQIQENDMLKDNILVFFLEPGEIAAEIRGLIANKFMAKYQRPCAILTHTIKECTKMDSDGVTPITYQQETYEGSMRGYTKNGLENFKALLEQCPGVLYVQGHENAAGLGIEADKKEEFLATANKLMEDFAGDPIYRVDYFLRYPTEADNQKILEIAALNDYWGQDIDRAYVGIRCKVTQNNFSVMKSNTLKITLDSGLSLIKFKGTEEEINALTTEGWVEIDAYCKCNINEWNGICYPQLVVDTFEVVDSCQYMF